MRQLCRKVEGSRMKKNPEITDATRQAFEDAFCALYRAKPIETITVKELTEKAGYNRCTFYQYFSDIYGLLTFLEDQVLDHGQPSLANNVEQGDVAGNFVYSFTQLLTSDNKYIEVLLNNPNSFRFAN